MPELRAELHAEGLDRQTPGLALAIPAMHVILMFGGLAVFVFAEPLWLRLVALAFSTYGAASVGMTGHNASHYAVTGHKTVNRAPTSKPWCALNQGSPIFKVGSQLHCAAVHQNGAGLQAAPPSGAASKPA